ncbi:galactose ABC transporter substrate-binding protein [uncultured Clostridium sp.]|uniref:galactose ABC transporter substrate-binding protein n=1 Tax=uncultured Clostridium sp. TaxID=59620 RepID=UPI0028E9CE51|nr:galactose ABC transporter substrate-binding protein [uncultured Clostridium sp.]
MQMLKKLISLAVLILFINTSLANFSDIAANIASAQTPPKKVSVFLLDFTDDLISDIRKSLEDIQKENIGKVKYTFYDGKSDQTIQNKEINKVLKEGATDLILLNIVDRAYSKAVINRIKEYNIPVILFNREPLTPEPIRSYSRALYIGTDGIQAGTLQGEMLVNAWNTSKRYIDKNGDGIMQYVMLEGEGDNAEAIQRTKYSVLTIEKAGIKVQQVALEIGNWHQNAAYNITKSVELLFQKYNELIEVIISNDDTMAIGAVKALHEYGYNKGDKLKTIPVVGVDVVPEAKELIEKGFMLGSFYQDPRAYGDALYACGMNLINHENPVEGTKYTLDDTGVSIRLPQNDYFYKNIFAEQ